MYALNKNMNICTSAYESDYLNRALGEVLHPGGLQLTERMAKLVKMRDEQLILDIASGRGSTIFRKK